MRTTAAKAAIPSLIRRTLCLRFFIFNFCCCLRLLAARLACVLGSNAAPLIVSYCIFLSFRVKYMYYYIPKG